MKKKIASDESVREAMENLYKGTAIERAMELTMRMMQEENSRKTLASFLLGRLSPDFLRACSHLPIIGMHGDNSNEQAVITWANMKLNENPEQLREITSEFMVDTYYELQEILIENQYI